MRGQPGWSVASGFPLWMRWVVFAWCLGLLYSPFGVMYVYADTAAVALKQPLTPAIQEIEVVYVDGQTPTVSLHGAVALPPPAPLQLTEERVDLLPLLGEGRAFGGCEADSTQTSGSLDVRFGALRTPICGYMVRLQRAAAGVDVLSYTTLHLRGRTQGHVTLALADEAAQRREENVPLTRLTGDFDVSLSLTGVARQLDLRRLTTLVLLPETPGSQIVCQSLTLERSAGPRQPAPRLGFWVWDYRQALAHPETVLETCQRERCTRLLIQMPALADAAAVWEAYARFLSTAPAQGVEAFALDGYPEAIDAPEALLQKVQRLRAVLAGRHFAGLQLDIEPYLLEGFFVDETGLERYVAVLEQVRHTLGAQARFSVVIPFWFAAQTLRSRPVAFTVMDRADEVAVMSYRTDVTELRAISADIVRYGDLVGTPVWLALETLPLPVEHHIILKREARHDLADAYVDQTGQWLVFQRPPAVEGLTWFRMHHKTIVRPERLTFAGQTRPQVRAAVTAVMTSMTQHASLVGMLIHDLKSFLALPE